MRQLKGLRLQFRVFLTFHLEEIKGLDGLNHGLVVQAELKVRRDSCLEFHIFREAPICITDAAQQRTGDLRGKKESNRIFIHYRTHEKVSRSFLREKKNIDQITRAI